MAKKQTSTRNTEFNYYVDNEKNSILSAMSKTATTKLANITLLDSDKSIRVESSKIIEDASKNKAMSKYKVAINTDNLTKETYYLYGSPHKWVLDNSQQYNNCGVVSTMNILVMADKMIIKDQNKTEKSFTKQLWDLGLVEDDGVLGVFDYPDGGTFLSDYKKFLADYGINSKVYVSSSYASGEVDGQSISLIDIADAVKNGGAAIVAVCSGILWGKDSSATELNHAITVTGVLYDSDNPADGSTPAGFYIHDSGGWMTRYISYDDMINITFANRTDITGKSVEGVFGTVITDNIKTACDNINATGTKGANTLIGNLSDNILKGLDGNDTLIGNAGNDKIYGGNGSDIIFGNGIIKYADKEIDINYLVDEDSDKNITGKNYLNGGAGNDYIFGGNYNDEIYGGKGNDYIHGGDGIDVIYGDAGNDTIYGDNGNDKIYGNDGNDTIYGGSGDDTIIGGAGNDSIYGGVGNDKISCGKGNDNVYFENNCAHDIVVTSSSGNMTLNFVDSQIDKLNYSLNGSILTVSYDDDNSVEYNGFYNSKKNSCQKAYIKDMSETSYRLYATKSSGKIKVASTTGNNILFSQSTKNNTITTSKGNDIVFMNYGNDKITYTGGKDYYYSLSGDDTYTVNTFGENTYLSVSDNIKLLTKTEYNEETEKDEEISVPPSKNDTINLKTDKSNIRLLFNVRLDDEEHATIYDDLFFVSKEIDNYSDVIADNSLGFVKINDYFDNGKIETVKINDESVDIDSYITSIANNVVNWLLVHNDKNNAFDAITNNVEGVEDLVKIYSSFDWQESQNPVNN